MNSCKQCETECRWTYCSISCQQEYQYLQSIDAWFKGDKTPGVVRLRNYLHRTNPTCWVCGIDEWQGQPIGLEMDHIDGDPYNDRPENLRLICPNCHSQTPTFRNKNKGNGRVARRERARADYQKTIPSTEQANGPDC